VDPWPDFLAAVFSTLLAFKNIDVLRKAGKNTPAI
jgi:hypothetical protein